LLDRSDIAPELREQRDGHWSSNRSRGVIPPATRDPGNRESCGVECDRSIVSTISGVLNHLSLQCRDPDRSATFYDAVLAPLGGGRIMQFGPVIGYGVGGTPSFWIGPLASGAENREVHVAFDAEDRAAVRAFFDAAAATGAEMLHEPRIWPEYHPNYYGAFVRDPDGNNVEAVCHTPEGPSA
jgi:catechol 2,3-dioxygenase-like lactoylglutathione lyase family enzyme